MTRKRKARRVGSEGPAEYTERKLSKEDIAALARKRAAKRKGLKAGSRHSSGKDAGVSANRVETDPRLGSKKAIPLVVEDKPHPKSNQAKKVRRLTAAQELEQLEQDPQLNVLLDRLENNEKLGAGLQSYVDEKLDRIEQLMSQLGLLEETEQGEGLTDKKHVRTDNDLFDAFTNSKYDEV